MLHLHRTVKADKQRPMFTRSHGGRRLRHELKFLIDVGTYHVLRNRLAPLMEHDGHSENGEYRVTSVYFDDIYRTGYVDKLNGIDTRRKFRIRSYGLDPSFINLESKHKDNEFVSKVSGRITEEQYRRLLAGDCSFMCDSDDAEDVFGEYYRADRISALKPAVIVDYHREAFIYPFGNVRITFDKKLSTCYNTVDMFDEKAFFSPVYDKDIILEVKYDDYLPASIWSAIQGVNAPQQSVSKYVLCCDKITEVKAHVF